MAALIAAFAHADAAERAAEGLLNDGVPAERLSLLLSDENRKARERKLPEPGSVRPPQSALVAPGPNGVALVAPEAPAEEPPRSDLNPAQNDYPRTEDPAVSNFVSHPAEAKRDFLPNLDTREYEKDYDQNEERENATNEARDIARTHNLEMDRSEGAGLPSASVKTIADADQTVKRSALVGLGVGAAAAATAIAVPGLGLILGGGALALATASLAARSDTGEVSGGLVGYLRDRGMEPESLAAFRAAYEGSGALLEVEGPSPDLAQRLDEAGAQALHVLR